MRERVWSLFPASLHTKLNLQTPSKAPINPFKPELSWWMWAELGVEWLSEALLVTIAPFIPTQKKISYTEWNGERKGPTNLTCWYFHFPHITWLQRGWGRMWRSSLPLSADRNTGGCSGFRTIDHKSSMIILETTVFSTYLSLLKHCSTRREFLCLCCSSASKLCSLTG